MPAAGAETAAPPSPAAAEQPPQGGGILDWTSTTSALDALLAESSVPVLLEFHARWRGRLLDPPVAP